jgi:hypothetical protein
LFARAGGQYGQAEIRLVDDLVQLEHLRFVDIWPFGDLDHLGDRRTGQIPRGGQLQAARINRTPEHHPSSSSNRRSREVRFS